MRIKSRFVLGYLGLEGTPLLGRWTIFSSSGLWIFLDVFLLLDPTFFPLFYFAYTYLSFLFTDISLSRTKTL